MHQDSFYGGFVLTFDHLIVKVSVLSFSDVSFSSFSNINGGLVAVDDCFVVLTGFVVVFATGLALGFADPPVLGSS